MAMSMSTTYTGVVRSVNERGLKLDGHDSYFNVSKFAPPITLPERGETVTVCVDAKGFLRSCELADGPAPIAGGSDAVRAAQGRSGASDKDRTITRLAVLKAAAEYAASKPESKSTDVLAIAAAWERWVNRPSDDTDLTDAF